MSPINLTHHQSNCEQNQRERGHLGKKKKRLNLPHESNTHPDKLTSTGLGLRSESDCFVKMSELLQSKQGSERVCQV